MAKSSSMAASSLVVLVLLVVPCVFGVDHTVGDSTGWALSGDYATWASGKTFTVGDNLVFNYDSSHGVDQVSDSDYSSCSSSNALKTYSGGNTKVPLTTAGKMNFICPTPGHCSGGMKLSITVVAAGSTPTTPTTPTSPSPKSPSTPTTPSTTTPTTASPPPPSGSGAVGGLVGVKELMGSLVVSSLILALMC